MPSVITAITRNIVSNTTKLNKKTSLDEGTSSTFVFPSSSSRCQSRQTRHAHTNNGNDSIAQSSTNAACSQSGAHIIQPLIFTRPLPLVILPSVYTVSPSFSSLRMTASAKVGRTIRQ